MAQAHLANIIRLEWVEEARRRVEGGTVAQWLEEAGIFRVNG